MSFKIEYSEKMIIATFNGELLEPHILNAFIELTENGNITNLNHIIFDYTSITSFNIVADFVKTTKMFIQFSVAWNKNINAIAVTTNTNLRSVVTEIIKHNKELVWNHMLFEKLDDALKWCDERKY